MAPLPPAAAATPRPGLAPAMPIMIVVFVAFLVIGMALPVLPLHVHQVLGFGPSVVGLVAGGQFVAALLSRLWAGSVSDTRGPKLAVTLGLVAAAIGGIFYLISLRLLEQPVSSVSLLLVGRTLVGGAESLIITGGMSWGLALISPDRSAKVIAWVGMAMFAALAVGAPLGSAIFARFTFFGIAVATIALPLVSLAVIAPLAPLVPETSDRGRIRDVLRPVLLPGLGFALSGITFGAVTAFLTLYFSVQGWANGALAFTIFAVALIAARVIAGHLPDRFGGARVALWCLGVQAIGLLMIGLAGSSGLAMTGAAIAGAGFSLVFPSLGLEAVRRAPPERRGLAMGTYNAFLDLTLGVGSPVLGWLAGRSGIGAVFIASAIAAVLAVPLVLMLRRDPRNAPSGPGAKTA